MEDRCIHSCAKGHQPLTDYSVQPYCTSCATKNFRSGTGAVTAATGAAPLISASANVEAEVAL
jgi:hypothetical protein